ncbi:MAG: hypothetical protein ACO31W_02445 [Gemmatimonadaceae bacterium]
MTGRTRRWWTVALTAIALLVTSRLAEAQRGGGEGFLFFEPGAQVTIYGGLNQPGAGGDLFGYARKEFTLERTSFRAPAVGFDLAFSMGPRTEILFGIAPASSNVTSEYRDWVDGDDKPIEQTTAFRRAPLTASVRYYLKDRGRSIGSTAWIPAKVVPFVGVGFGTARYSFEQVGDFVDFKTLDVLPDRLTSSGWAPIFQGSGGVQLNLSRRLLLTGEMRYLRGSADASTPNRDFIGYRLDLSGLTTLVGFTLRL